MKNILFLAIILFSSFLLTNKACAQSDLGINAEHIPDFLSSTNIDNQIVNLDVVTENWLKCYPKNSPVITPQNDLQASEYKFLTQFPDRSVQTLMVYERNGVIHHTIYYNKTSAFPKKAGNNEKIIDNDFTTQSAADFLFTILVTKPPTWYITRMSVVLK